MVFRRPEERERIEIDIWELRDSRTWLIIMVVEVENWIFSRIVIVKKKNHKNSRYYNKHHQRLFLASYKIRTKNHPIWREIPFFVHWGAYLDEIRQMTSQSACENFSNCFFNLFLVKNFAGIDPTCFVLHILPNQLSDMCLDCCKFQSNLSNDPVVVLETSHIVSLVKISCKNFVRIDPTIFVLKKLSHVNCSTYTSDTVDQFEKESSAVKQSPGVAKSRKNKTDVRVGSKKEHISDPLCDLWVLLIGSLSSESK